MKDIEQLGILFDSFYEAIYIVDPERNMLFFNTKAEEISGFHRSEVLGKNCYDDILNHVDEHGTKLCKEDCPLACSIREKRILNADVYLHHKDGHRVPVRVRTIPMMDHGVVSGAIEVFTDNVQDDLVTAVYQIGEQLNFIDPVLKIFNRTFLERKNEELLITKEGMYPAIFFIDIDNFKKVNDQYGHLFGDEVLKIVSKTLRLNSGNGYVIRFGGEEILILHEVPNREAAMQEAKRLCMLIQHTNVRTHKIEYQPTISIGVALVKEGLYEAIHCADRAMYEAKKMGKNQAMFYDEETASFSM